MIGVKLVNLEKGKFPLKVVMNIFSVSVVDLVRSWKVELVEIRFYTDHFQGLLWLSLVQLW